MLDLTAALYTVLTAAKILQGPFNRPGNKVIKSGTIFIGNFFVAWGFILLVFVAKWDIEAASDTPKLADCLQFAFAQCSCIRGISLAAKGVNDAMIRA